MKLAVQKLKLVNWLYKYINDASIDKVAKNVIEVASDTSSTMLEKATDDDITGFQAYTIRNLDNRLSIKPDIEQYKLVSVRGNALENMQHHLNVMCFLVLFPTGTFGEFHPREVKLSTSEYVKSRLLNKDSRFCKDP